MIVITLRELIGLILIGVCALGLLIAWLFDRRKPR